MNQNGNRVFVQNMRGQALMPTTQRNARILLKQGKAKIAKYNPFTIQLKYPTGEAKQDIHLGVDTGSENIGIAITSGTNVLYKAVVKLRQDVSQLIKLRSIFRRNRRSRKTRYRAPRFLNRKKPEGWLPPSIQNRINHHFKWIDEFMSLLPVGFTKLHIEVAKFDIAKIINPEIKGIEYQQGNTYGFYNDRYYVFSRDNYECQVCGCKGSKENPLHTHHKIFQSCGGSDRVDNLVTVCTKCHSYENHQPGGILYEWMVNDKELKQYKEPTFMNILRIRMFQRYPNAIFTYGSITTPDRKELGLEKTHYNDAIAISGIKLITENPNEVLAITQFRRNKRSLHEANARKGRKEPNRTAKRNNKNVDSCKGFYRNDKVSVLGKIGYIYSFTHNACRIKDKEGNYITLPNKSYTQLPLSQVKLLNHNNNWQYYVV